MSVDEDFERRIERQRREFYFRIRAERAAGFSSLGFAIIEAAVQHFDRGEFHHTEIADYLVGTNRWPYTGRKRKTPAQTVDAYCHQRRYVGDCFHFRGNGRFRIKDEYPREPTGMHERYFDFRTDPNKEFNVLPCGCRLIIEPNLAISVIYCEMHQETIESLEASRLATA